MFNERRKLDVEFSLALNNRTGKYFVCHDMLQALGGNVGKVRYWRTNFEQSAPGNLYARILGRLMTWEFKYRSQYPAIDRFLPPISRTNSIVFTDPLQAVFYDLNEEDGIVCHDLGPITHPHFYAAGVEQAYKLAFAKIAAAKPRLAFVSEGSRNAYDRLYGPAYSTAEVVYPAIRQETQAGVKTPLAGVGKLFLLTVGAVGSRKNQLGVIAAFKAGDFARRGYNLVIAGGPEPGVEAVVAAANAAPGVILPGYVTDDQLRWLYANAAAFVLPSYLEGFGFPAAEAALRGLVPVISREGALKEICGPGAIRVDEHHPLSILTGIEVAVSLSKNERAERLLLLRQHIGRFTDEAAASGWRKAFLDALPGDLRFPAPEIGVTSSPTQISQTCIGKEHQYRRV